MTDSADRSGARAAFLALPLGTRVVVRYRIEDVAAERKTLTDALGFLVRLTDGECTVRTRKGDVTVMLANIVAAKQVPPAPSRIPR